MIKFHFHDWMSPLFPFTSFSRLTHLSGAISMTAQSNRCYECSACYVEFFMRLLWEIVKVNVPSWIVAIEQSLHDAEFSAKWGNILSVYPVPIWHFTFSLRLFNLHWLFVTHIASLPRYKSFHWWHNWELIFNLNRLHVRVMLDPNSRRRGLTKIILHLIGKKQAKRDEKKLLNK
jgi:hypothetical protein